MKSYNILKTIFILLTDSRTNIERLADQLDVSTRTVKRYIQEILCLGLPIYTTPGKNGGINFDKEEFETNLNISDKEIGYFIDTFYASNLLNFLFKSEYIDFTEILRKTNVNNIIDIDFSKWCKNSKEDIHFNLIKQSIISTRQIEFDYYDMKNSSSHRIIDPYKIVFKENDWYVLGFCHLRNAARVFKIKKITKLTVLESSFKRDERLQFDFDAYYKEHEKIELRLEINKNATAKAYEDFELSEIQELDDRLIVTSIRVNNSNLLSLILSYGCNAKIVYPDYLIPLILDNANNTKKIYKGDNNCH